MTHVQYFVGSSDENLVISRFGDECQVSAITYQRWEDGDIVCLPYHCYLSGDKCSIRDVGHWTREGYGRWTKKIPLFVKNVHREVWGLPPLKEETVVPEWFLDYQDGTCHCPTEKYVQPLPIAAKEWLLSRQLGNTGAKRSHWFRNKDMYKTWVFPCPTAVLVEQLVPLLEGSPYVAVLKPW